MASVNVKWIIGIVLGVLLVYVGAFGASAFGLSLYELTGNFLTEDFNYTAGTSPSVWQVQYGWCLVQPYGTYFTNTNVTAGRTGVQYNLLGRLPTTQFTFEWRMQIAQLALGNAIGYPTSFPGSGISFYQAGDDSGNREQGWLPFGINKNGVTVGAQVFAWTPDTAYHVWKIVTPVFTDGDDPCDVYRDGVKIGSSAWIIVNGVSNKLTLDSFGGTGAVTETKTNFDYIYGYTGGGGTTGQIKFTTTLNGSPLSGVTCSYSGGPSPSGSGTTGSDGTWTSGTLQSGSYQVSCTHTTYGQKTPTPNPVSVATGVVGCEAAYTTGTPEYATIYVSVVDQYNVGVGDTKIELLQGTTVLDTLYNLASKTWTDKSEGSYTVRVTYTGSKTCTSTNPWTNTKFCAKNLQTNFPAVFTLTGGGQTYTCPTCGAQFSTQAALDAHIQAAHTIDPFQQILAWIRGFMNNYQARMGMLGIGGLVTAVSVIMFIYPLFKKGNGGYPRPQPYPRYY
jgi:hypothetical protein